MALTHTPPGELGSQAPSFALPGVDGKVWKLSDFSDSRALVVVFMCNHCPYVIAVQERINRLAQEYASRGVRLVGISSNDTVEYPEDNLEAMRARAREQRYVFPYLIDETQEVARAYGAVCTPDFFVYQGTSGAAFELRYRGRLDDSWKDPAVVKKRELAGALDAILAGQSIDAPQNSSMGCNIKWKDAPPRRRT